MVTTWRLSTVFGADRGHVKKRLDALASSPRLEPSCLEAVRVEDLVGTIMSRPSRPRVVICGELYSVPCSLARPRRRPASRSMARPSTARPARREGPASAQRGLPAACTGDKQRIRDHGQTVDSLTIIAETVATADLAALRRAR